MVEEIKTLTGTYKLVLITDFKYFLNICECDDNAAVIMLNQNDQLVSDNYFACMAYLDDIEEISKNKLKPNFISQECMSYMD